MQLRERLNDAVTALEVNTVPRNIPGLRNARKDALDAAVDATPLTLNGVRATADIVAAVRGVTGTTPQVGCRLTVRVHFYV
jgi:hypothetical protein